jgi:xylulokinase
VTAQPGSVLALDLGTQSTRAALVTADGVIADCASSPIGLFAPRPGRAEQDPSEWWQSTLANVRTVLERNPAVPVLAVGTAAQMHSAVPVDAAGEPLVSRVGLWSDKRASAQVSDFSSRLDAKQLAATAGNEPLPAWTGFKMAWFRDEMPGVYERAKAFLAPKDFVNLRLCGELATDPSEASGTFLADAMSGQWSPQLLGALDLDRALLPPIAGSGQVIGKVRPAVCAQTGLPAGTPVVAGGGDMLCQLLAAGVTRPGRLAEVAGTASIVAGYAATPHRDPRVMSLRTVSGGWVDFGIIDAAGSCLHWLASQVGLAGRYSQLDAEAALVPPGSNGLLFLPHLLGERTLGSAAARGSFVGLTLQHTRGHLARAVMEGICFDNRRALELIAASGEVPLRCAGGGARSDLWNQIRADIYDRPVSALAAREGGILGAALLAGQAAGWYDDAASAAEQVGILEQSWRPDSGAAERYRAAYATFRLAHDALDPGWARWYS